MLTGPLCASLGDLRWRVGRRWRHNPETPATSKEQITVLYDAFGKVTAMKKDWGFAALVEVGGKRILFDTGNNPDVFAQNVTPAGVDLTRLDFVVMSHRSLS